MLTSDAYIELPVSGSAAPSQVFLRTITQASSASFRVVTASTNPQLLVPANPNRIGQTMVNDSPVELYLRYGSGSVDSYNYSQILPLINKQAPVSEHEDLAAFTGPVYGVWPTATGSVKITEFFA